MHIRVPAETFLQNEPLNAVTDCMHNEVTVSESEENRKSNLTKCGNHEVIPLIWCCSRECTGGL